MAEMTGSADLDTARALIGSGAADVACAISIVIAARNMALFLADTLESVLADGFPELEIVVIDDGSTDQTRSIAEHYASRHPCIRVLARDGGEGVSAARNAGLALARGAQVLFLDADDLLVAGALGRLTAALAAAPHAPAAFGDLLPIAEDGTPLVAGVSRIDIKPRLETLKALVAKNFIVNGGTLLIRRTAIDAAGGYPLGIAYGEDWEFWCRLAVCGDFVVLTGEPVLLWRQRAEGANNRARGPLQAKSIAALDAVVANSAIAAKLGAKTFARQIRARRIDLYWASARQELRFGSPWRFVRASLIGVVRFPDSVLQPRLIARFLGSLVSSRRGPTR